jgi:hypothetical protein
MATSSTGRTPLYGKHTPHLMTESLGRHNRYLRSGDMRVREEN